MRTMLAMNMAPCPLKVIQLMKPVCRVSASVLHDQTETNIEEINKISTKIV